MNIIIAFLGAVAGIFLWSQVIGSILVTLPLALKHKRQRLIKKVPYLETVIVPTLLSGGVLLLSALFLRVFFLGSLVGLLICIFQLDKYKNEAFENLKRIEQRKSN